MLHWLSACIVIDCFSLAVNILEQVLILRRWGNMDKIDYLFMSLSLSDALSAFSMLFTDSLVYKAQINHEQVTTLLSYMLDAAFLFAIFTSMFHTLAIAIERLFAVRFPLNYHVFGYMKTKCLTILSIWFSSVTFTIVFVALHEHAKNLRTDGLNTDISTGELFHQDSSMSANDFLDESMDFIHKALMEQSNKSNTVLSGNALHHNTQNYNTNSTNSLYLPSDKTTSPGLVNLTSITSPELTIADPLEAAARKMSDLLMQHLQHSSASESASDRTHQGSSIAAASAVGSARTHEQIAAAAAQQITSKLALLRTPLPRFEATQALSETISGAERLDIMSFHTRGVFFLILTLCVFLIYALLFSLLLYRQLFSSSLMEGSVHRQQETLNATLLSLFVGFSFSSCLLPITLGYLSTDFEHPVSNVLLACNPLLNSCAYFVKAFLSHRRKKKQRARAHANTLLMIQERRTNSSRPGTITSMTSNDAAC